jgi:1,4-alpha-glucan branching enzyme
MVSQENISTATRMGANLVAGGGVTFRVWAPLASAVFINGTFSDPKWNKQTDDTLMAKDANGYWTGFAKDAKEGDKYHFSVKGPGSSGFKRDPYARELVGDGTFPNCTCFVRAADSYPWHDASFVTPDFSNMVVYQLHIGTYAITKANTASTFLDVIGKIPYLMSLGINVLQPLPVDETETDPSMGYDGADVFSPDFPFVVTDGTALSQYMITINNLLKAKSLAPLTVDHIKSGHGQLKALVDLCHVYGIAVAFDVVYNHAGGFSVNNKPDDNCIYYWDRAKNIGNNNDSLYFTEKDRGTGGLSFALWKGDVRQFLINNALYYIEEFHVDGFRYDEISSLLSMNLQSGFNFCRDLTNTLRFVKPRLLQNAEYWPFEFNEFPKSSGSIVASTGDGGAGFDVLQHDGLREAVRGAVHSSSFGQNSSVDFQNIKQNLFPGGLTHGWQAVTCVENHDKVKVGAEPRIVTLADSRDRRSWYARSRSRFATGILLTAPGIPQIFMGQEFLEDKQWDWDPKSSNLLFWDGLNPGVEPDPAMRNHLHFTQDLIRARWNQPALRGDRVNPFFASDADRVIAFHRWLDGSGEDVVVAATLSDMTWYNYSIGFPYSGQWREIFNSDVYDNFGNPRNPQVAGNGGGINASGPPMHGFQASASIVIPANGLVIFARA